MKPSETWPTHTRDISKQITLKMNTTKYQIIMKVMCFKRGKEIFLTDEAQTKELNQEGLR